MSIAKQTFSIIVATLTFAPAAHAACGGVVKFRPGESQATYRGAVSGYEYCDWR